MAFPQIPHHLVDGYAVDMVDVKEEKYNSRLRDFDGLNEDLLLEAFVDSLVSIENGMNYNKMDRKPHFNSHHMSYGPPPPMFGMPQEHQFDALSSCLGRFGPPAEQIYYDQSVFKPAEPFEHAETISEISSKKRKSADKDSQQAQEGKIPKGQSIAAKERRRERNKVLARKTRVKKKNELESLRDQVCSLRSENEKLKGIVQSRLPRPICAKLLIECDMQLPENVASLVQSMIAKTEQPGVDIMQKIRSAQRSFCITNFSAQDNPIVYASPGFMELTGYPIEEILGRNCRFLQGPDTSREEVSRLGQAIQAGVEIAVTIKNYRRDGSAFWNFIQVSPLKDAMDKITLIVGVQCEVSRCPGAVSSVLREDFSPKELPMLRDLQDGDFAFFAEDEIVGNGFGDDGDEDYQRHQFLALTRSSVDANAKSTAVSSSSSSSKASTVDYTSAGSTGFSAAGSVCNSSVRSGGGGGSSADSNSNSNDPLSDGSQYGGSGDGDGGNRSD